MKPKRLMIYDNTTLTDSVDWKEDGLAYSWFAGGKLYRVFRWVDKCKGVGSWEEALDWMIEQGKESGISQIQYWGHGSRGNVWIGREPLNLRTLKASHKLYDKWAELRTHLTDDALIWFRTCSTYNGELGHVFAQKFTDFMGCKTAAHTFIIGPWQGGLHTLEPGEEPYWDVKEGLVEQSDGTWKSKMSWPGDPNTIFCLKGSIPEGW
jgi:hypothetical protein